MPVREPFELELEGTSIVEDALGNELTEGDEVEFVDGSGEGCVKSVDIDRFSAVISTKAGSNRLIEDPATELVKKSDVMAPQLWASGNQGVVQLQGSDVVYQRYVSMGAGVFRSDDGSVVVLTPPGASPDEYLVAAQTKLGIPLVKEKDPWPETLREPRGKQLEMEEVRASDLEIAKDGEATHILQAYYNPDGSACGYRVCACVKNGVAFADKYFSDLKECASFFDVLAGREYSLRGLPYVCEGCGQKDEVYDAVPLDKLCDSCRELRDRGEDFPLERVIRGALAPGDPVKKQVDPNAPPATVGGEALLPDGSPAVGQIAPDTSGVIQSYEIGPDGTPLASVLWDGQPAPTKEKVPSLKQGAEVGTFEQLNAPGGPSYDPMLSQPRGRGRPRTRVLEWSPRAQKFVWRSMRPRSFSSLVDVYNNLKKTNFEASKKLGKLLSRLADDGQQSFFEEPEQGELTLNEPKPVQRRPPTLKGPLDNRLCHGCGGLVGPGRAPLRVGGDEFLLCPECENTVVENYKQGALHERSDADIMAPNRWVCGDCGKHVEAYSEIPMHRLCDECSKRYDIDGNWGGEIED